MYRFPFHRIKFGIQVDRDAARRNQHNYGGDQADHRKDDNRLHIGFRAYNRKALGFLASDYPDDYPEPEAIVQLIKMVLSSARRLYHEGAYRRPLFYLRIQIGLLYDQSYPCHLCSLLKAKDGSTWLSFRMMGD
jgi:hypothetical protein